MHPAVGRDGPPGRDERLAGDLAAEDPLEAHSRARSPEEALVDLLQVEDAEERVHGVLAHEDFPP
ncbi:hypothetical protein GALLR39Z86_26670 [Glycomyces algeriensis]|uniref:Uncharacterized protein n=1 Tax=Glycomyces algeriensis TaxID=256037 RepID=A0A9W6G9K5_9ACTN|nr:hypothetical protein GALLR39Z86_26670 [Glycomyces algeriensis]